ncbi:hypothetical protein, partial [Enterococcus faecium]
AEALDATGQPDLAWRIRRHAWLEVRNPQLLRNVPPGQLHEWRDRLAALAPLFMSADDSARVMRALLRSDVTLPPRPDGQSTPANGPAL